MRAVPPDKSISTMYVTPCMTHDTTLKNTHLRLEVMYDPPIEFAIFTNFVTLHAWT